MRRKLLKSRVCWFLIGLILPSLFGLSMRLVFGPTPMQAMPFDSYFEESRSEFFFPADYGYTLKSKVDDRTKFETFVEDMKMKEFRVSDNLYEEKNESGSFTRTVSYENGFIIYNESQI